MNNSIIKLPVAELKAALTGLAKVVNKHSTLPVLGHLEVKRDPQGCVSITGTDLDTFATRRLEGEEPVGSPARFLVPFAELQKLGKTCPADETLELEPISEDKLILRHRIGSQPVEQVITTPAADDFPRAPEITTDSVDLDEAARVTLLNALDCASDDPTRLIIQGAYLDVSRSGHYFVATDGRHLFASNSIHLAIASSVLIPDHRFISWGGFAKDGQWKLAVQEAGKKDSGYVRLESPRWSFITKQIDGNYPNWRQIVEDRQELTGTLEISDGGAEELRRIMPRLPGAESPNHVLGLTVYGTKLFLRGRNKDQEPWTEVEVPGVTITGDPATVYLNRQYLLKAIGFGLRQIGIQEPLRPLRFHDNGSRQMVVMPVRVESAPVSAEAPVAAGETTAAPHEEVDQSTNTNNQQERNTPPMQNGITNGNGHSPTSADTAPTEKPGLEQALDQIEFIKTSIRGAVTNLNTLADALRQMQRDRRSSEREIRSVRDMVKTLQTVRL
jgi:DNA polymerase III sliding clamp (beta) subunit (PCNA family)